MHQGYYRLLSPEIEPTSGCFGTQVCADLIGRRSQPPPRQPVRRVIKTLAILGAEAAVRVKFSKIARDTLRTVYNELGEHAELRRRLGRTQIARLYKHGDARHTPCFRKFPPIKNKISFEKIFKNAALDNYVTHIRCVRLQLRISAFGPLYSWEHELVSLLAGSYPDHRRGVTHFLARSLSTALHFAAV
ncbi:Hypothetical_protein [Hexamita inflata]|uniref:Hypothetical_protein n=1 Tax=Hexamita inflata TaxID=28002 RepID=A0AA86P131_9EUKA|nr:Hypothetical protein HINF_LOCUS15952 [Hexamita inflata]